MQTPTTIGAVILILGIVYLCYIVFKRIRKEDIKWTGLHTAGALFVVAMIFVGMSAFIPPFPGFCGSRCWKGNGLS